MLKRLVLLLAALVFTMSTAFAASVDVNSADQATLESLKGIGPVKSQAIIDERAKHGPFKDADDLARRVKGLGAKSVTKLEGEGLTIGGSSTPPKAGGVPEKAAPAKAATAAQSPANTAAPAASPAAATLTSHVHETDTNSKKNKKSKKNKSEAASATSGK